MFGYMWHVKKVASEMTIQGKHYSAQRDFFKELWKQMRESFTEENHISSATWILERFLEVLPLQFISKDAFISTINEAYDRQDKNFKEELKCCQYCCFKRQSRGS